MPSYQWEKQRRLAAQVPETDSLYVTILCEGFWIENIGYIYSYTEVLLPRTSDYEAMLEQSMQNEWPLVLAKERAEHTYEVYQLYEYLFYGCLIKHCDQKQKQSKQKRPFCPPVL